MRALAVVVAYPIRNPGASVIEAEEQGFVEKLVPHPAVEAFTEAVLHRLAPRNEMPVDLVLLRPGQHGIAGELGAVVGDDHARLAALIDQRVSSRATRRPGIEVSGMAARHSRVT